MLRLMIYAVAAAAMGDYWPVSGFCSRANFEAFGAGCIGR